MEMKFKVNKKEDAEVLILVCVIGLLEGLENKALSIENCEDYLFSPYTVDILERKNINEQVINIINLGCELEDIQSLIPQNLDKNIKELKNKAISCLDKIKSENPEKYSEKWLENN